MALIPCPECGIEISSLAPTCPQCGVPLRAPIAAPPTVVTARKSRGVAAALALLLGGLGAHRFYLNRPGSGVLYLLFCWTLIPAMIAFLEGIIIAFTSEKAFQAKYGG